MSFVVSLIICQQRTGDEQYLEYARHALKFLYDHGWNNGWYFITDIAGNYVSHWGHNDWWSFQQHYALVGISAMVEATGGKINWNDGAATDHSWLIKGIASNYTKLWDANPATKGYFNYASTNWSNRVWSEFIPSFFSGPVSTVVRDTSAPVPDKVGMPRWYTAGFLIRSHP